MVVTKQTELSPLPQIDVCIARLKPDLIQRDEKGSRVSHFSTSLADLEPPTSCSLVIYELCIFPDLPSNSSKILSRHPNQTELPAARPPLRPSRRGWRSSTLAAPLAAMRPRDAARVDSRGCGESDWGVGVELLAFRFGCNSSQVELSQSEGQNSFFGARRGSLGS